MNKYWALFFIIFLSMSLYAEKTSIIERMNEYGGRTYEITMDETETRENRFSRLVEFYDGGNVIRKRIITPSPELIANSGIREQTMYYVDGTISKYKMVFTEEHQSIHIYDAIIEDMDSRGNIINTFWLRNNIILDQSDNPENRFPFYTLCYIEQQFFEDYDPASERGTTYFMSAKYTSARSVITFDAELHELNAEDTKNLFYLCSAMGAPDFAKNYSKKVKGFSGDRAFWIYMQTQLIPFVLGQEASVKYYPLGRNGELYLMCIGFYDVRTEYKD